MKATSGKGRNSLSPSQLLRPYEMLMSKSLRSAVVAVLAISLLSLPGLAQSTPPASDTFFQKTNPAKTNGASTILAVQSGVTSFIQFNLSTLPGAEVGTYPVGVGPFGIAFDGTNIWVANSGETTVTKLLAGTGAVVGTHPVGSAPFSVSFDGTNIWISNFNSGNVTKLLASTGAEVGTYPVGPSPFGVAFDGTNIWVANYFDGVVTKLLASTGAVVGTYSVATNPVGVAFDGSNIWVTNHGSSNVSKIPAF